MFTILILQMTKMNFHFTLMNSQRRSWADGSQKCMNTCGCLGQFKFGIEIKRTTW